MNLLSPLRFTSTTASTLRDGSSSAARRPSPTSRWRHKLLILNMAIRRQVTVWREEHGHPRSSSGNPAKLAKVYQGGGTAGAGAQIHKPAAVCGFSQRALQAYCVTCRKSICINCAIDSSRCKSNNTRHLDAILSGIRRTHTSWVAWLEGRPEKLRPSHGCSRRCRAQVHMFSIGAEEADLKQQLQRACVER